MNNPPYFDGRFQDVRKTFVRGSSARLEYNAPLLCDNTATSGTGSSNGNSVSTVWSMVVDGRLGASASWAQVGWIKNGVLAGFPNPENPQGGTHRFVQWTKACKVTFSCGSESQYVTKFFGSVNPLELYGPAYDPSDRLIHFWVEGQDIAQMDYSASGVWTTDWAIQFAGETKHPETNMSGRFLDWTELSIQASVDVNGVAYCATGGQSQDNPPVAGVNKSTIDNPPVAQDPQPNLPSWYQREYLTPGCYGIKIWTNHNTEANPDPA